MSYANYTADDVHPCMTVSAIAKTTNKSTAIATIAVNDFVVRY